MKVLWKEPTGKYKDVTTTKEAAQYLMQENLKSTLQSELQEKFSYSYRTMFMPRMKY